MARALVLLYHQISDELFDPWYRRVHPSRFDEQLRVLASDWKPVSLQEIVVAVEAGELPDRAVAVTFDDGYADNLLVAKPALERHQIPATVFVTSNPIIDRTSFWWDELDAILLTPGRLPPEIAFELDGATHSWVLGQAAQYSVAAARRTVSWRGYQEPPTMRHRTYLALLDAVRPLPAAARRRLLDDLATWAGGTPTVRGSDRPLSPDEARRLADGELVRIGAHTVTHAMLSSLPAEGQRAEIVQGRSELEALLGTEVKDFAYPYGDLDENSVRVVRAEGFRCACSTAAQPVEHDTNPHLMPRFAVDDWGAEEFRARLEAWYRGDVRPDL